MNIRFASVPFVLLTATTVLACSSPAEDGAESGNGALSDDVSEVVCKDGRHEKVTPADLASGQICMADKEATDPFDPKSCLGTNLGASDAAAFMKAIAPGQNPVDLGKYTMSLRTRSCVGTDDSNCSAWTTPTDKPQSTDAGNPRYGVSGDSAPIPSTGKVTLTSSSAGVSLGWASDPYAFTRTGYGAVLKWTCDAVNGKPSSCKVSYKVDYHNGGGGDVTPDTNRHPFVMVGDLLENTASNVVITTNCARFSILAKSAVTDGKMQEEEAVFLAKYSGR